MDAENADNSQTCGGDAKNNWKRRSKLEQKLIASLVIVGLLLIGLALFIIIRHAVATKRCTTPGCLLAASTIVTHIYPAVDPCDDFFKFACSKFIESTHGDIKAASIPRLKAQVERQLEEIIQEPIDDDDHYTVKSQKEFFQACMNKTAVEEESLDVFKQTLEELNGWPVVVGYHWNEQRFDWKNMIYALRENGYPHGMMLDIGAVEDPRYTNRYIIGVISPYIKKVRNEHRGLYIKYMTDVAVIFGAERNRAGPEMEKVLDFMENLRKVVDKHESEGDENKNKTAKMLATTFTVQEYGDLNGEIGWLEFINTLLYPVGEIAGDDYVWFPKNEFTRDFFNLIHKTHKRIQANYIIWMIIEDIMEYMTKELKERKANYTCVTNTSPKTEDRSEFCQRETKNSFFPQPSEILYARRYLPANERKQVKQMVHDVKMEFQTILMEAPWMDEESKKRALEKANAMVAIIGTPRDYFNDGVFQQSPPGDEKYQENIENGSFFKMLLGYRKRQKDADYFHIHMSVNDTKLDKFYNFISYVDAMYSLPDNVMMLPVGILQDIFYDAQRPMYLNYGAIGGIIGHEFTHGFSKAGSGFDKDGRENSIWTNKTREAYEEKIECMIKEAESFELESTGHKINGTLTLEENIADYAGLKVAYAAYKQWVRRNGAEPQLPGIDYTPYQLFWISAISYECFKLDPESVIKRDAHADSSFRGTGPMRNNPDFAKDFNCPTGSRMNPSKKCQVF